MAEAETWTEGEAALLDCQADVRRGLDGLRGGMMALARIRDEELYRASPRRHGGFMTFSDFCEDTWGITDTYAEQLIEVILEVNDNHGRQRARGASGRRPVPDDDR